METAGNPLLDKINKIPGTGAMTFGGTASKALLLLSLLLWAALYTYKLGPTLNPSYILGFALGGLIIALITIFIPKVSPFTSPIYALLEGALLGAISFFADYQYPGIVVQAIIATCGVFLAILLLYSNRVIRVNHKFIAGVSAAIFGIFILYFANFILSFFNISVPVIHDSTPLGIGFSVVVVCIAALSLAIDFNRIEEGVNNGAPKLMEWYSAFGLMVSLIWLYLEILRLLQKTRR